MLYLQIIFLETLCNDPKLIERNIRLKVQQSPDYAEEYDNLLYLLVFLILVRKKTYIVGIVIRPDFEAGYRDFKNRLDNYEKVILFIIVIMIVFVIFIYECLAS